MDICLVLEKCNIGVFKFCYANILKNTGFIIKFLTIKYPLGKERT